MTRQMGADPVIVSRDAQGKVHVLLNVCRHRGRKVCTEDSGRTTHFRCGYHGWTYNSSGRLTGLPFADAYQGRLDKGPMAWILDLTLGRTDGTEVTGPPVRWLADASRKLGATNFVGDGQHIFTTHGWLLHAAWHARAQRTCRSRF